MTQSEKLRAPVLEFERKGDGIWFQFQEFDVPPEVPLVGELVELYETELDTLWIGKIDTVDYTNKVVYVRCDWS
ncbi:MAG: hypothetical protein EHM35_18525 [Planctomycetaceae bacterium]|nr:MAG: hypothetical protein EHM35_18525 [Planctomycetaceae bacterium]